ncbi:bestrophin family protein [Robiginitomaculum antarcticum]|uniref:bestrophin family ion channel n=1 Tax=Robiginitomaculum antarcticum TaxID=437507 RepID=UPI00036837D9|nr:bestrophin family ion channel [Robiginitomaculum antarcticum]
MIIEKNISFIRLFKVIWKQLLAMVLLASVIIVPIQVFNLQYLTIDMATPLILGTALSIFLGFQTNSAYERWMTGRSTFGQVRCNIRNMAILLTRRRGEAYINHKTGKPSKIAAQVMPRMLRRMMAYIWVLNRQLKGLSPLGDIEAFLDHDEYEALKSSPNPAYDLLLNNSRDFRIAQSEGQFYDGEHFEMVGIHRGLITAQNTCESLKNTPFPAHYIFFTKTFIWLLIILTSLSLPSLEEFSYFAILLVVLIGWMFSMIMGIGSYMDEPFVNNRNVIPMDSIARDVEIAIKSHALGETDLPPAVEPIEGALY